VEWDGALQQIKNELTWAILDHQKFGSKNGTLFWLDPAKTYSALELLFNKQQFYKIEFEHILFMQVDQSLVVTYVFKLPEANQRVYLRGSFLINSKKEFLEIHTVSHLWKKAEQAEKEASVLYGVLFEPIIESDKKTLRLNILNRYGNYSPPLRGTT